jgi:hypothetical protein
MLWPIRLPNLEGLATQQQVERRVHLPSQERPKRRVGVGRYPAAVRETAAGVFLWPAGSLDDPIKREVFKDNNFSHE